MKNWYDQEKNQENIAKHGISFDDIAEFELENAFTKIDNRFDYGEVRYVSYGLKGNRLHVLVWTERNGEVRPISFRKANMKERKRYEKI
ncbi:MAG: BrnT family toxin [Pseudomonadota bacterium]